MGSNNSSSNQASLFKRSLVELIGTLFFVFVGAGSAIGAAMSLQQFSNLFIAAFANGLAVALAVTATMNIFGGHINPAVTIGALVTRRIKLIDAISYIVAQLIGAALAGAFLFALTPKKVAESVHYGSPSLDSSISIYQGIFLEMIMTFFLVYVIFATAKDKRAPKVAGFAIGLTVTANVFIGGPLTGAALNPARAFGPELAAMFFKDWYVYWIGPILGAIISSLLYNYLILE